jgi:translocator protein
MIPEVMIPERQRRPFWQIWAVFLILTAMAAMVGGLVRPGAWYASLAKPIWNPPNWLFAPVWSALYLMIAAAGALAWRAGAPPRTMALWGGQMVLNGLWTLLFFGLQRPDLALIEIALMWLAILLFIVSVWPVERRAGWLMLPYLAWVSFAAVLNGAIWWLNR